VGVVVGRGWLGAHGDWGARFIQAGGSRKGAYLHALENAVGPLHLSARLSQLAKVRRQLDGRHFRLAVVGQL